MKLLVVLLFVVQWTDSFTGIGPPVSCCTQTSKDRVRVTDILSYVHQDGPFCHIKAVRFLLVNGKTICSDPENPWAKQAMNVLDRRKPIKAPTTPLTWTETTTSTSSPKTSTESRIITTTPKRTSTTWKPTTSPIWTSTHSTIISQIADKEREAQDWTEHFCQWSEIQETRYCTFYYD